MKLKTYSVTKLTKYIATLFTNDIILNTIRVEGEVSKCIKAGSGHIYFNLKDDEAVIPCVMFRQYIPPNGLDIKDGAQVVIAGKVNVFVQGGRYQLICTEINLVGEGDSYAEFLKLKEKLQNLGYFDEAHKKALPKIKRVGLITSKSGDAVHDYCSILEKRDPRIAIDLYPSLVQGDKAAANIIQGIKYFNALQNVDAIVITRGGGSKEDLWCFNDEKLAVAIYDSKLPVVSAIGHQADFSISDFVADLRAATPSNAAELMSEDINVTYQIIDTTFDDITYKVKDRLDRVPLLLEKYNPETKIAFQLQSIKMQLQVIPELMTQITNTMTQNLNFKDVDIVAMYEAMQSKHPQTVLDRGYVMAKDQNGKIVSSVNQLSPNDIFSISFKDGDLLAQAIGSGNEN